MPLPESSLTLGPHTNPGESEHSKPKVAMLVKLSTETLDAIQALGEKPAMDFEFGDAPGIYIGDTFYPMRPLKEQTPHELYLRTHSASKPTAPLKLYANVTGKFYIEHDELDDTLKDKIRERTQDAAKQRDDRRTKFIDTLPVLSTTTKAKKRKEPATSSMFRNAIRPSDQAKLNAAASSSPATTPMPPPPPIPSPIPPPPKKKPTDAGLRKRLVHCIAIQERPRDVIVKLVAGAECDAARRREVLDVLEEVGEPIPSAKRGEKESAGSRTWRLKTESWTEVRPYEWQKLLEQDRINLARTGRQKLASLGIKQTDPLWEHFAFRATTSAAPVAGPSRTTAPTANGDAKKAEVVPKRGVSSKEVKEKPKVKAEQKEILMKDESVKARASNTNGKARAVEDVPPVVSKPTAMAVAARKVPGSGFRINKSTDIPEGPNRPAIAQSKPVDRDVKPPRPSLPSKPAPPAPSQSTKEKEKTTTSASAAPIHRIKKLRESDVGFGSDSDRERGPERPKDVSKSKSSVKQEPVEQRREVFPLKRKQVHPDATNSEASAPAPVPQKKRRTETGAAGSSSTSYSKPPDSLPMKPDPAPPRTKIRKEPSPLPKPPSVPQNIKKEPPAPRPFTTASGKQMSPPESVSSSQSYSRGRSDSKASSSTKRRRSPIYTSSSEDDTDRRPKRDASRAAPPTNGRTATQAQARRPRVREPRPLPTDHTALRARYSETYNEYVGVYAKVVEQKTSIDAVLRKGDSRDRDGDSGSTTDSDAEQLIMDENDLTRLSVDHKRLREELETIRGILFPGESH
ncbi:hypothetical protein DXG03_005935 [Asterophora parasitica]|uniref:RNA polymerase II elongation factor ELL N-terminal domain-containing protein n=1 Tax=Asterophora parasitica TaxID=117018 RepID=A0A9P7FZH5_9AGAR|nr:hypothetical protein DXG03_005935 [Asterophora parasitica]